MFQKKFTVNITTWSELRKFDNFTLKLHGEMSYFYDILYITTRNICVFLIIINQ